MVSMKGLGSSISSEAIAYNLLMQAKEFFRTEAGHRPVGISHPAPSARDPRPNVEEHDRKGTNLGPKRLGRS